MRPSAVFARSFAVTSRITTNRPVTSAAIRSSRSASRRVLRNARVLIERPSGSRGLRALGGRCRPVEVHDLGPEQQPLHLRCPPALNGGVRLPVEPHEVAGRGLDPPQQPALARAGQRPASAPQVGVEPGDRAQKLGPAAPVVVAVRGLPPVEVGDVELELERERTGRRGLLDASTNRSPTRRSPQIPAPTATVSPRTETRIAA